MENGLPLARETGTNVVHRIRAFSAALVKFTPTSIGAVAETFCGKNLHPPVSAEAVQKYDAMRACRPGKGEILCPECAK